MAGPFKRRNRLKSYPLDSSQKSIKSFCVTYGKAEDTNCFPAYLEQEKIIPHSTTPTTNTTVINKKKQTLLAPFNNKRTTSSSFKIKRMNRCSQNEKVMEFLDDHDEENESGIDECCKQVEVELAMVEPGMHNKRHEGESSGDTTFGLFGVDSSEDEELEVYFDSQMSEYQRCCFSELPDEILENIFCQLPLVDLLVHLSVVCKRWHEIISNTRFLLWKKRYYLYKYCVDRREEINDMLAEERLLIGTFMFPTNFARFMAKFRVGHKEDLDLRERLRNHSKHCLIEKFQQQGTETERQSCWATASLLALVSSSVYDIAEIVTCLASSSACLDVIECLHCIALVFFALMQNDAQSFSSSHYRLYYALYLYENSSHCDYSSMGSAFGANLSGQQCILKYSDSSQSTWLTNEQVRIMNHNTKHGDVLKIVAFAGTGKTTTLIEYTKLRPSWRFLNVAYNKSVQEQAEKKFPDNVVSRTVHSLAYRAVGFKYKRKLGSGLRVNNIMANLPEKSANFLHAKRVIDTLSNFICSYDLCLSTEHIPYIEIIAYESEEERKRAEFYNSDAYLKIVARDSKDIWAKMSDPYDLDVRITHDGYLKVYQLSKPVIDNYDCILIDEAQDCTPAVADILLNQVLAKILVGDPHQQIYGFRGATNAMAQVTATHTYYLTQSFRFGPEIASVAAALLDVLKGVRSKTIVGVSRQGGFLGDQHGQLALICRTNFILFNNAVLACTNNSKTRIAFAGGIKGYNLDRVLDIYKLFVNAKTDIKDTFIKGFKSFHDLKKYALKAPDPELLGKIRIVEAHNVKIPAHIEKITRQHCRDIDQADIVFATAHKSKGLEFDTVRLAEDFLTDVPLQALGNVPVDEKNLLYVAVTRAKHRLQLPTTLYNILMVKTDLLLTYEQITTVKDTSATFCVECKHLCDFDGSFVAVKRPPLTLGTTQKIDGGCLCSTCVLNRVPFLGNMICAEKM